jgi:hypothetical protein
MKIWDTGSFVRHGYHELNARHTADGMVTIVDYSPRIPFCICRKNTSTGAGSTAISPVRRLF